jgi:hypothetical protein
MANEEPAPAPTTQMPGLLIASRGLHRSFARKRLIPYPANEAGCTWVGFSKLAHHRLQLRKSPPGLMRKYTETERTTDMRGPIIEKLSDEIGI